MPFALSCLQQSYDPICGKLSPWRYQDITLSAIPAQNEKKTSENNELEKKVYETPEEKSDLNQEVNLESGTAVTLYDMQEAGYPADSGDAYFHVFFESKYCLFLIRNGELYRIFYESTLVASKASVSSNQLSWSNYNVNRLKLPSLDAQLLIKNQDGAKRELQEIELETFCENLLIEMSQRPVDQTQVLQLLGNTPEQSAEEQRNEFYRRAFGKYQHKVTVDLRNILNKRKETHESLIGAIREYLANIGKIVTPMYFGGPNHPTTQGLIELAKKVASFENNRKSAHELLLPTIISFETSARKDLFHADLRDLDLTALLKTHVPNDALTLPMPVSLCLNPTPDAEGIELFSPYYSDSSNHQDQHITPDDWLRLWNHSPLTRELQTYQDKYDRFIKDSRVFYTLLGQIQFLCQEMGKHDAHVGHGSAEEAGEGVYVTLIKFFDFYDRLDDANKLLIPNCISGKIAQIREQLERDGKHREGFATCIGSHRSELARLLTSENQVALSQVSISGYKVDGFLQDALSCLDAKRQGLKTALASPDCYVINQKIHITPQLLEYLELTPVINNVEDCLFLQIFSPNEISALLKQNRLLKEAMSRLIQNNFQYLFILISIYPAHSVAAVLRELSQNFSYYLFVSLMLKKSLVQFQVMIQFLNYQQAEFIFEAIPSLIIFFYSSQFTGNNQGIVDSFRQRYPNLEQLSAWIDKYKDGLNIDTQDFFSRLLPSMLEKFSQDEMNVASILLKVLVSYCKPSLPVCYSNLEDEKFSYLVDIFKSVICSLSLPGQVDWFRLLSAKKINLLLNAIPNLIKRSSWEQDRYSYAYLPNHVLCSIVAHLINQEYKSEFRHIYQKFIHHLSEEQQQILFSSVNFLSITTENDLDFEEYLKWKLSVRKSLKKDDNIEAEVRRIFQMRDDPIAFLFSFIDGLPENSREKFLDTLRYTSIKQKNSKTFNFQPMVELLSLSSTGPAIADQPKITLFFSSAFHFSIKKECVFSGTNILDTINEALEFVKRVTIEESGIHLNSISIAHINLLVAQDLTEYQTILDCIMQILDIVEDKIVFDDSCNLNDPRVKPYPELQHIKTYSTDRACINVFFNQKESFYLGNIVGCIKKACEFLEESRQTKGVLQQVTFHNINFLLAVQLQGDYHEDIFQIIELLDLIKSINPEARVAFSRNCNLYCHSLEETETLVSIRKKIEELSGHLQQTTLSTTMTGVPSSLFHSDATEKNSSLPSQLGGSYKFG